MLGLSFLLLPWWFGLINLLLLIIIFKIIKIVSILSLILSAVTLLSVYIYSVVFLGDIDYFLNVLPFLAIAIFCLLYRHKDNMARLLSGEEKRI